LSLPLQSTIRAALLRGERLCARAFGDAANPFSHLGALGFYFFWIVAVSGIYLYIFFETSIATAYESVEHLTHAQWYLGGVMRSLHRYASDAMVLVMGVHLLREYAFDRLRGPRWYSWLTGLPLVGLIYACGINGYWLVWDRFAQYLAITTAEWLDWLPFFSEPIARNFLNEAAVSDRFFSLLSFLHIGLPLFLLLLMWVHIQRLAAARVNPPRVLAVGTLLALLALSFVFPAVSLPKANLDTLVGPLALDWFFVFFYPLIDRAGPGPVWIGALAVGALLVVLPWVAAPRREPAAVVNLANCNGCGRCFADCPYDAVTLQARSDGLPFEEEAVVDGSLCVACGICVGACPTATPFRRVTELAAGIELPAQTVHDLRERTLAAAAALTGDARVLVFGCRQSAALPHLQNSAVGVVMVSCSGALPPPFIDFVLSRRHAEGVMILACNELHCYHRQGNTWTAARLAGTRDPQLRARVARERLLFFPGGQRPVAAAQKALAEFRARLVALPPRHHQGTGHGAA
jgi:ferredoxin/coenzyme F420-reducing hydrogenase delta subunit